jgi:hypothetical protein
MTFLWSLPLLVLLGAHGSGYPGADWLGAGWLGAGWGGWLVLPLALLAHDLTFLLWRALQARRPPNADAAHDGGEATAMLARCIALLVAGASASAAWQWQASLPEVLLQASVPALAPVLLHGVLPALLLGAPGPSARSLLARHLQFAGCTLVAALTAMLQPAAGAWLPFMLACVIAALALPAMTVRSARTHEPVDAPGNE